MLVLGASVAITAIASVLGFVLGNAAAKHGSA